MEYSSFWRRFGAALIDDVLTYLPLTVVLSIIIYGPDPASVQTWWWELGIAALWAICYRVFFEGRYGVTAGLHLTHAKLVIFEQPNRDGIGYARAFVRFLLWTALHLVANVGFLWILLDPRGRTLADRVLGTVVVHDPSGKFGDFDPARLRVRDRHAAWFAVLIILSIIVSLAQLMAGRTSGTS
jgi:uncharacterized RDD family membrane protein YckC